MAEFRDEICIEEIFTVRPAIPSECNTCKLSWPDILLLSCNYNQKCLVYEFPKCSLSYSSYAEWFQGAMQSMRKALADTLVHFYPFAGRLKTTSLGSIFIDCSDQGAEFIQACAPDITVDNILQDDIPPLVKQLFPMNGAINAQGQYSPLLVVQVTRLNDGMVVALTANHSLVDGTSFWHFIQSWAEICRGKPISSIPLHTRWETSSSSEQIPLTFVTLMSSSTKYLPSSFHAPELRETMFHFSKEHLSHLKEEANKYREEDGIVISSFQALCAHLWQAITRARGILDGAQTTFQLSVNWKKRVDPPLPDSYWGNTINSVAASMNAKELLNSEISYISALLNAEIAELNDAAIKNLSRERKGPRSIFNTEKGVLEVDESKNILKMGSSHRFPVYEADFGWGRPLGVRSGWANKLDGKLNAYPSASGNGSIDIEICLRPEVLSRLQADPLFLCC